MIRYINGYGAASHVSKMHGNRLSYQGFNEYAVSRNDGIGKTLYMEAAGCGMWQVKCHVQSSGSGYGEQLSCLPWRSVPLSPLRM